MIERCISKNIYQSNSSAVGNTNDIDDETVQLKAVEMGLRAKDDNKPIIKANKAAKDTGIVQLFNDP